MPELNPDFALQSRLSFGRGARYGWALTAVALFLAFDGFVSGTRPAVALVRAGLFLLLGALPYGAIQVRVLERQGHLDARRLTGGSPLALGLALVGGSAWVLLFAGAVLLLAAAATGQRVPPFTLAALLALGVAMALVMILMPSTTHVDSWMLLVLLAAGVYSTVESMRTDRGIAFGVMVVSAVIIPWALPLALRRLRGATAKAAGLPVSVMRLVIGLGRTAHPELARGLLSAGQSFSTAALMAVGAIWSIWWLTRNLHSTTRDISEVLAVYGPLILAGYDTAARVHHEHRIGGLDRIRLSGQPAWKVVLEFASAYSAPFVAVSLLSAGTLAVLDPRNAPDILALWPIFAGVLILAPLAAAFRGRKPGFYVAAAIPMVGLFARLEWGLGVVAIATAFGLAVASMERPVSRRPDTWRVAAGAAGIAAVVAGVAPDLLLIGGLMSLAVWWVVPDGTRMAPRTIAICAAAAAMGAWLAEVFWGKGTFALTIRVVQTGIGQTTFGPLVMFEPGSRIGYLGLAALYAASGLAFGAYALNRFRARAAFALRAAPLAAAVCSSLLWDAPPVVHINETLKLHYGYRGSAIFELLAVTLLTAAAAVLAWRDRASLRGTRPPS